MIGKPGRNAGRRKRGSKHRIKRSGEWKFILIKINMSRSVGTICVLIKTKITLGIRGISNEDTFSSFRFKFMSIVRPKVRITSTPKYFELS